MKFKFTVAAVALAFAVQAPAAVLFSDSFQTDLSQWSPSTSGVINSTSGGYALSFGTTTGGGDLRGLNTYASTGGHFHISFDYLGTCGQGQGHSCGGFLGFDNPAETWLAGSGPYGTAHPISETGSWQTISFDFTSATPIRLKLEDWNGAGDSGTPGNAYFRNLVLSGSVPEPETWALMIAGFAMIGVAARRKAAATA